MDPDTPEAANYARLAGKVQSTIDNYLAQKYVQGPEGAGPASFVEGAKRLRGVLHDGHAVMPAELQQGVHVAALAGTNNILQGG